MSELLTTGEMIDRLKVGEIAKKENSDMHVTRESASVFSYCGEDGDTSGFDIVGLNGVIHIDDAKWRILPNYVSFEEAMKSLKDGKEVELHNDDGHEAFINRALWDEPIDELTISNFSFKDLLNGKWTIEED